jgi:hypothetical protein
MSTSTTREGCGYVVTCRCNWLRFWADKADAERGRVAHEQKCTQTDRGAA